MELTITGNNVASKGKQLHGIILNNHVVLPSNEDFVIFDNEEQKNFVLFIIKTFSGIKLKYDNALLVSEADIITDNTIFEFSDYIGTFITAVTYYLSYIHTSGDVYTLDLSFLKFFKNIKRLYLSPQLQYNTKPSKTIIDCKNIEVINQFLYIDNILLLNTDNIKTISSSPFTYNTKILNSSLSFPKLETLETYGFFGIVTNNIINLGKITEVKTNAFGNCTVNHIILPETCHTIQKDGFSYATINKLTADYVTVIKQNALANIHNLKVLSLPNLLEIDNVISNGNEQSYAPAIYYNNDLEEIRSLGKITVLPKLAINSLAKLIYLDIPSTLRTLGETCISNINNNNNMRIQNTLDFSNVTTINKFALSNIKANILIFPEDFTGDANYSSIINNVYANKYINVNSFYGISQSDPNVEITISNNNDYSNLTSSDFSQNFSNKIGISNAYTLTDYTNPSVSYIRPAYITFTGNITCGKLTIKSRYIKALTESYGGQYIYKELILPEGFEYISGMNFYGDTLTLPDSLKYISRFYPRNLKTLNYSNNLLLEIGYESIFQGFNGSQIKPANFYIPAKYYASSAINTMFVEEPVINLPEGLIKTWSGGISIYSQTCEELIIPSTMTHLYHGSCMTPNLHILTIKSKNFSMSSFTISSPIDQLNIDGCEYLKLESGTVNLKMEVVEFPASLKVIEYMPMLNNFSCLRKIIFKGTTELRNSGANFVGNPLTVKEIINVHMTFINASGPVSGMSNLEKVTFADNLPNSTTLGSNLCNKSRLREIKLPNTITTINSYALTGTAISEIDIPESITFISNYAFKRCSNLRTMIIRATTPPTAEETDRKHVSDLCTIYVPSASLQLYKESPYWRMHANQIEAIQEIPTSED